MIVNAPHLERRVTKINQWLQHHPETHYMYKQEKQKRDYYVNKLTEMDEYGLKTIKI